MKKLFPTLASILFCTYMVAQNPRINETKYKKKGYKEYQYEFSVGGNIKSSNVINTLEINFKYYRYFDGHHLLRLFLQHSGYNDATEEINGKHSIIFKVKAGQDTLEFNSYLIDVNFWSTNGVKSERPDRYINYSFYYISDEDLDKIIKSPSKVEIIKFGIYENVGWYFTDKNIADLKYLLDYINADII